MKRLPKPLDLLIVIAVAVPLGVAAALIWHFHARTLAEAETRARGTATILREHAQRVFEAQVNVIDRIDTRLAGLSWDEIERSEAIHLTLKGMADESPHIRGIWLVRPDGRTAAGAEFFPVPRTDVTERDYFQALRERPDTYLGGLIQGHLTKSRQFNISRRRSGAGAFDGLILVTSDLRYFEGFWAEAIGKGPHIVAIVRDDGSVLARHPTPDRPVPPVPAQSPFHQAIKAQPVGTYAFRSATDDRERLYGYARLDGLPASVLVGLDEEAVLQPWRQQAVLVLVLAALVAASLFALVEVARRQQRQVFAETLRRRRAETDLIARDEHLAVVREAEAALALSAERYRVAVGAMRGIVYDWDLVSDRTYRSEGLADLIGVPLDEAPPTSTWWRERMHPEDRPRIEAIVPAFMRDGPAYESEYRLRHRDGHWVWVSDRGAIVRDEAGRAVRAIGSIVDVTERKLADERQQILLNELNHRVKNTLAAVQSIAVQTARTAGSAAELAGGLQSRIIALSRAHDQLIRSNWERVSLRALVEDELAPYRDGTDRVLIVGPDVGLNATAGVPLSLILHELATNAAKYGALAAPTGRLHVHWTVEIAGASEHVVVALRWIESGGPRVEPPSRRGFGSRLVTRGLDAVGGEASLVFAPEGVRCTLRLPLAAAVAALPAQAEAS